MTIFVKYVFQEDNKHYLQVYLHKCLHKFVNKL